MVRTRLCFILALMLAACCDDDEVLPGVTTDAGDAAPPPSDGGIPDASVDANASTDAGCNPTGAPCIDSADVLKCCSRSCSVSSNGPSVCE